MFSKTTICILCLGVLTTCRPIQPKLSERESLLKKTVAYLWKQQQPDGSWKSETHGLVKTGQLYTAFILWTLMDVPAKIHPLPSEKVQKALDFIRKNLRKGVLGVADEYVLEYPNYATAYGLRVLVKNGDKKDKGLIQQMITYLVKQQFDEDRHIDSLHVAYGGWGFGETRLAEGEVGHVDVSHTRRILQALQVTGYSNPATYQKARRFLQILQKHPSNTLQQPVVNMEDTLKKVFYDGGFYYSSVVPAANKAKQAPATQTHQAYFRSYATATCDGLLSLWVIEKNKQNPAIQSAYQWLLKHPNLDSPEGIPTNDPDQWHTVMFYYHLMVRAEVYKIFQTKGDWKAKIFQLLKTKQHPNGSFANPLGARNKEDDPLLASAFVVVALVATL
jgi:hypothetical protein